MSRRLAYSLFFVLISSVNQTPRPAAAATHIDFLGQRFIPRLTEVESFGGVGFDPINRHILSVALRGECDEIILAEITGDNGVAWDPVTEEFWFINSQREVYRYVQGNPQVLFALPEDLLVPGVGVATLDRPEGLALDMEHVYVVDAGPNEQLGELESNEWFKFTRDGTPVSSSGATDFTAQLQPHFDQFGYIVVSGIAWIPPDAPFGQGQFLVAIENTGLQVLDADGMYLDRIVFAEQGLVPGTAPFGLAGVCIDPLRGDIYLVDNGNVLHVWERLPEDEVTSHVYGVAAVQLHRPASPCDRQLLDTSGTGLEFSLTYREADGLLWSIDFATGMVYTRDPLYPVPQIVGDAGIANVWGMAYDDERDIIYLYREFGSELHALDPATLETSFIEAPVPFVRELAFNAQDKGIYGRGDENGQPVLIRLDRDTGASTVVGPTAPVSGMGYDPQTGKLVGIGNSNLYEIDPATGQAQIVATGLEGGWEGLAVVPIAPLATSVDLSPQPSRFALRLFPNPLFGHGQIAFELARSEQVRAGVYDLAGRRVATLHEGELGAGPRNLSWNSRDDRGRAVPSGVYYVRVSTPTRRATAKVTVVR